MIRSIKGLRVLNTRPKDQAKALSKNIIDAGGISIECPALEIVPANTQWMDSLPHLDSVDQAIFVSANAVHYCFTYLQQNNIHWPEQIQVIAIGQGSANTLKEYNIQISFIPKIPDSEHLLAFKSLQELKNKTVLLFKGEGGRRLIEESLLLRGANLFILEVYRRVIPKFNQQFINSVWRDDLVDIILFTSEQSMQNLFTMFGEDAYEWLKNKPCLVLSERLASSASLLGMKEITVSHPDWMMNIKE